MEITHAVQRHGNLIGFGELNKKVWFLCMLNTVYYWGWCSRLCHSCLSQKWNKSIICNERVIMKRWLWNLYIFAYFRHKFVFLYFPRAIHEVHCVRIWISLFCNFFLLFEMLLIVYLWFMHAVERFSFGVRNPTSFLAGAMVIN